MIAPTISNSVRNDNVYPQTRLFLRSKEKANFFRYGLRINIISMNLFLPSFSFEVLG